MLALDIFPKRNIPADSYLPSTSTTHWNNTEAILFFPFLVEIIQNHSSTLLLQNRTTQKQTGPMVRDRGWKGSMVHVALTCLFLHQPDVYWLWALQRFYRTTNLVPNTESQMLVYSTRHTASYSNSKTAPYSNSKMNSQYTFARSQNKKGWFHGRQNQYLLHPQ